MKRRVACGSVALLFGAPALARTAGIIAVRVWPADEYTRVTIESDARLSTAHALHANPPRLAIDVTGLELSAALRELVAKVRPDDPHIAGVRIGQFKPRVVRLVFDLKQPIAPQLFALEPVAAYRHRLLFDLYPTVKRDPLLGLMREKELAEREAAAAVRDALDDLISSIDKPASDQLASADGKPGPQAAEKVAPAVAEKAAPAMPDKVVPSAPGKAVLSAPDKAVAAAPPKPSPNAPLLPSPAANQPAQGKVERLIIVAIDPGHGGEDPGAIGPTGLREKDVVLAVALQLRDRLNRQPGMRAMLTRDADYFIPLAERVRKARRVQADLFVSIHADAFMRPEARGASVFALSDRGASSAAARWLANRENAADLVGGVNARTAHDATVMRTMLDMSTTAQIKDSLKIGTEVLGRLGKVGTLHKPRVEQAGFAVLKAPDIPSILVETAFISNPEEESRLRSPAYRERLVQALADGIDRYFAKNPPLARSRAL